MLFLHFAMPPDELRPHLPDALQIDTFPDERGTEMAWIGLVPFRMEGVRLNRLPAVPGHSAFPETNVRTYVHLQGRPAVWFFSLDAASTLACRTARTFFHLPYWEAAMSTVRTGDDLVYQSRRSADGAQVDISISVSGAPRPTEPGTLEHFLVERYRLVCTNGRDWFAGNVHHTPYEIRHVSVNLCSETMISAAGFAPQAFTHSCFADGVDVEIGPLERIKF